MLYKNPHPSDKNLRNPLLVYNFWHIFSKIGNTYGWGGLMWAWGDPNIMKNIMALRSIYNPMCVFSEQGLAIRGRGWLFHDNSLYFWLGATLMAAFHACQLQSFKPYMLCCTPYTFKNMEHTWPLTQTLIHLIRGNMNPYVVGQHGSITWVPTIASQ